MPTVLMHTRPLDEKEKIVTGPRVAWLPPYILYFAPIHTSAACLSPLLRMLPSGGADTRQKMLRPAADPRQNMLRSVRR